MNRTQEKLLTSLFKRAFNVCRKLNQLQVSYVLTCVAWNMPMQDEFEKHIKLLEDLKV